MCPCLKIAQYTKIGKNVKLIIRITESEKCSCDHDKQGMELRSD